jgi:cohesin loading factor subunit SCC2
MYCDVVQPAAPSRGRFLAALLRPFEGACNLAAGQAAAAREDVGRLAFLAYVAASLPYRRGDEPLVLLHSINGLVSRLAQEARDSLRRALLRLGLREQMGLEEEDEEEEEADAEADAPAAAAAAVGAEGAAADAAAAAAIDSSSRGERAAAAPDLSAEAPAMPPPPQQQQQQQAGRRQRQQQIGAAHEAQLSLPLALPLPQWVVAPLKASLGLSMLLVLKQYLMAAYGLSDERVAAYELKGERARAEAKALVSRSRKLADFSLALINPQAVHDASGELLAAAFRTFEGLLDNDAANYRCVARAHARGCAAAGSSWVVVAQPHSLASACRLTPRTPCAATCCLCREVAVLAALADQGDEEEEAAEAGGPDAAKHAAATPAAGRHGRASAAAADGGAHAAGLVVYSMEPRSRGSRSKAAAPGAAGGSKAGGSGRRGAAAGRSTGKQGKGSSKAKGGKGRGKRPSRAGGSDSDDDGGGDASSGDEDWADSP